MVFSCPEQRQKLDKGFPLAQQALKFGGPQAAARITCRSCYHQPSSRAGPQFPGKIGEGAKSPESLLLQFAGDVLGTEMQARG